MSEQISTLIDAIVDDNAVDAEKEFNSVMADKIADRLQTYRQEVAAKYFNPEVETEESDATE